VGWSDMGFPSWCVDYRRWAGRGQDAVELTAGAYGELGEDLAQVVLDGARTEEQPGGDLGVG